MPRVAKSELVAQEQDRVETGQHEREDTAQSQDQRARTTHLGQ